jgi:DNA-binding Xre family transcriptional regulator
MAETVLDELITRFRFKSDRKDIQKLEKGFASIKSGLSSIAAAAATIFGTGAFLGITANKLDELGKFADTLGISVKQLQELQFAAERAGVSTGDLRSSLLNVNKVIGESSRGYGIYAQVLARYGVSIRNQNGDLMTSFQLFKELNSVFSQLGTAQQFDLAQNLGLTPNTVKLLQQTPSEFNKLLKQADKLGLATRQSTENAAKFNDALANLKQSMFGLSSAITVAVYPVLVKVINFFTVMLERLNKHTTLLKVFGIALTALSTAFVVLKLRALAAWAAVFGPITLGAAALTALILLFQDVYYYMTGQISVTGKLINKFEQWIMHFKTIRILAHDIEKVWDNIANAIVKSVTEVEHLVDKMREFIHLKRDKGEEATPKQIQHLVNTVNQPLFSPLVSQVASAPSPGVNANKTVNFSVGGITVNAPTNNANEIANAVVGHMQVQFKKSVHDFDSGVQA